MSVFNLKIQQLHIFHYENALDITQNGENPLSLQNTKIVQAE